ncbi:MAG: hypothetical protein QOG17_1317 [Gammaproteobacteria bacterium]|jgi:ribosomal protein S18 acetylase RimI-like enzyme|nr:hypothetical protein [Gammaproteobacteria bacterium]
MNFRVTYLANQATAAQIGDHLARCDSQFVPVLSGRVDIAEYARKIASSASRWEAWSGDTLVGLVAVYGNDQERRTAYVTSVSVLEKWTGKGIATTLMRSAVAYSKLQGHRRISLEVAREHRSAIHLYEKCGFSVGEGNGPFVGMSLDVATGEKDEHLA